VECEVNYYKVTNQECPSLQYQQPISNRNIHDQATSNKHKVFCNQQRETSIKHLKSKCQYFTIVSGVSQMSIFHHRKSPRAKIIYFWLQKEKAI